jgi:hypothetical protein
LKRVLVTSIALLCLVLVFSGCASESEEAAVRDAINGYYDAGNAGNFEKAATYVYTGNATEEEKDAIPGGLEQTWAIHGDLKVESIGNITIADSMATGNVTLSWVGIDLTSSNEFKLKKDGGGWKLSPE